jgi:hypothetical protein
LATDAVSTADADQTNHQIINEKRPIAPFSVSAALDLVYARRHG